MKLTLPCDRRPDSTDIAAGQPIPGSRYVRGFCMDCGEPIRVGRGVRYARCSDCARPLRIGQGTRNSVGEYDGTWDNVVRALEECA